MVGMAAPPFISAPRWGTSVARDLATKVPELSIPAQNVEEVSLRCALHVVALAMLDVGERRRNAESSVRRFREDEKSRPVPVDVELCGVVDTGRDEARGEKLGRRFHADRVVEDFAILARADGRAPAGHD